MLLGGEELLHHAEETLGIKAGQHHRRRHVHPRGRRVHRRLHRGPVPAGQLPLLPPGHPGRRRRAGRRPAGRPPGHRGARRTARSPACASTSPPTAGPATPSPATARSRSGSAPPAPPPKARPADGRHRRPEDHQRPLGLGRRAHPRAATWPPAATRACGPRSAKAPTEVGDEVKAASLLGRGGAGFPAGTKWGFCPPGVWPRYLVVNGDESEPGTYKDRILMERDPHQLIEGVLIACYAIGAAQAFLYVRGEMALAQERIAAGPQRGLRRRLRRQEHPRHRLLRRHRPALGRRRLHRRRGDRAHRVARGQPGHAAPQAAVLPGGQGPVPAADDRQQRRDAVEPAVDHHQRRRQVRRARRRDEPGHAPVRGVGPREQARASTRSSSASPPSATSSRRPSTAAASASGNAAQGVHPRWRVGPVVLRGAPRPARSRRAPSARPARCSARAPSSSWTRPPTR